jgi:hypothetical protein
MVAVGRQDLSQSLGCAGQTSHPAIVEAEEMVIRKALEKGKNTDRNGNDPPADGRNQKTWSAYDDYLLRQQIHFAGVSGHVTKFRAL